MKRWFVLILVGMLVFSGVALSESAVDKILGDRFGSVTLTPDEIDEFARELTTTPYTEKLDASANLHAELENTIEAFCKAADDIKVTNASGDYLDKVNTFIDVATKYINDDERCDLLTVNIALGGTESEEGMMEFVKSQSNAMREALDKFSVEMKSTIDMFFEDSQWMSNGEYVAQKLIDDIRDIIQSDIDA